MSAAILLVLVLAVLVTLLSERYYFRWDVTASGEHTLSEKSLQVLKTIDQPVHIKAFSREGHPGSAEVVRLLGAYDYASPNITYELIDPDRNPSIARLYNVRTLNTMILEGYDRTRTVKLAEEESITNGLISLSKGETRICYWVTGHGERSFEGRNPEDLSMLKDALENENYRFEEISLMKRDIPEDATVVVVAAPEKPLFPEELKSLRRYLNGGGSLVIFLEPFTDGGLGPFLREYGILVTDDVIVDKMSRVMGGDFLLPMVAEYGPHEISRDFKLTSFFEVARSVEAAEETPSNINTSPLALTSPDSWAETDQDALNEGRVAFDEDTDRLGPLSLAVISEIRPPLKTPEDDEGTAGDGPGEITGEGKLVVFGDADFAGNKYFHTVGNADFIMNTMNYLAGRKDLITIQKRHKSIQALMLNREQGLIVFWIPVAVVPLCVLILGTIVFFRRRSR
ncbi:MAG: GldG family protein [Thermodesulfobacteriota bacterium]